MATKTVLERLKLELNNKDYLEDDGYITYLEENNLVSTDIYDKATMQRNLLLTVIDIFTVVSNDTDLMRNITDATTNLSVGECFKFLQIRIQDIKDKIATLPTHDDTDNEGSGMVSMMFYRNR